MPSNRAFSHLVTEQKRNMPESVRAHHFSRWLKKNERGCIARWGLRAADRTASVRHIFRSRKTRHQARQPTRFRSGLRQPRANVAFAAIQGLQETPHGAEPERVFASSAFAQAHRPRRRGARRAYVTQIGLKHGCVFTRQTQQYRKAVFLPRGRIQSDGAFLSPVLVSKFVHKLDPSLCGAAMIQINRRFGFDTD